MFTVSDITTSLMSSGEGVPTWNFNTINTLRPRRNGQHFADDLCKHNILQWKCLDFNYNVLNCVLKDKINNILALVQVMTWRRSGDEPLFELMMVSLLSLISVAQPQWINGLNNSSWIWHKIMGLSHCSLMGLYILTHNLCKQLTICRWSFNSLLGCYVYVRPQKCNAIWW